MAELEQYTHSVRGINSPSFADSSGVLTPRERQVAELITQSKTDKEIAAVLAVSFHTVRGHVKAIYGKLGVNKRTAVVFALSQQQAQQQDAPQPQQEAPCPVV